MDKRNCSLVIGCEEIIGGFDLGSEGLSGNTSPGLSRGGSSRFFHL